MHHRTPIRAAFLAALPLVLSIPVLAGNDALHWRTALDQDRSFVENKGQFDGRTGVKGEKVLFAVDEGALQILFTASGVTYRMDEKEKNYYRQRGDRSKPRMITHSDRVHMRWEGASTNVRVVAEGPRGDRHTYSSILPGGELHDITGVRGFERLVYKGLYPGIDVVYTIHPERGIKYALEVAPGNDPAQAVMRYADDRALLLDAEGNLRIATPFGDLVDHAPVSHYPGDPRKTVPSRFELRGNRVSFVVEDFDRRRGIVVDPWVVTPAFPNSNKIWDVEVDAASNVYIYGGDTPLRLRKYDQLGNLLWTYNTPWDTANYWIGSLITDPAGNSYITAGTDPRIAKVNTNGVLEWSANGGLFDEYWRMSFNCDHTEMVLGGTRLVIGPTLFPVGFGRAFRINLSNGSVISSTNVAALSPSVLVNNPNEIRAITASSNGRYYFMTLDTIGGITEDLNLLYRRNNSYAFSYQVANFGVTNMGINAIAASQNHIYTQNGPTLHKRNINTGEIIATATIPGGSSASSLGLNSPRNSGIVLDSCGNVVVGSVNGVYLFSEDLALLGSVTTPAAVYDVAINHNGEVVACGQGFLVSLALTTCAPPEAICCRSNIDPLAPLCVTGDPIALAGETAGGTWSGPGITDPVAGIFDPAAAGVGVHEVVYALDCGISTQEIVVSPCTGVQVCFDPATNTFIASNGVGSYVWEQQVTQQDCSSCFLGCFLPPGCAVNVLVWQPLATGPSISVPSSYPVRVTDAAGNTVVIGSAAEVPVCTPCPEIVLNTVSVTDATCAGQPTGAAEVTVTGGEAPVTVTWSPGNLTGTAQAGLAAGTYQVTATDANGCTGSLAVTIAEPPALEVEVLDVTNVTCAGNDGGFTIAVDGGTPGYAITWSNGAEGVTVSGVGQGVYTGTITDANGCTAQMAVVVGSIDGPTLDDVVVTASACDQATGTITVSATGTGVTYSIDGGATYQPVALFTGVAGGEYTVVVMDEDGCMATVDVLVPTPPLPVPVISGAAFGCQGDTLLLSTTQPFASYAWSMGATDAVVGITVSGDVTVTVTDDQGCTGTSAPFTVLLGGPEAGILTDPPSPQLPGVTVNVEDNSVAGDGELVAWSWDLGAPGATFTGPDASWTYEEPGSYWIVLVVTDEFGCTDTATVNYIVTPADIEIPNVFSPNNDGYNDRFDIRNIAFFRNELAIFNRWGNKVYEAKDYRNQWNAQGLPDGTYYYVLVLEDGREFTGHVTVLR